jgi:hypothetical protein
MANYNDGNWHGWVSGDCPVDDDSIVEALWIDPAGVFVKVGPQAASSIAWDGKRANTYADPISAFRVVNVNRTPREIWVGLASGIVSSYKQRGMVLFREVIE